MSLRRTNLQRRRFLRGAAGATLGLPFLDVFAGSARFGRRARAATPPPVTCAFVVNMNGVQQAGFGDEPERFWPTALGPLTSAGLAADGARATSVLARHAERLLMIRGLKLPFPGSGCSHSGSGNQLLTAAKVSDIPDKNKSLAMGESVDNYIARRLGIEPLTLYAGPKDGYINDHISFRGPKEVRVGENNPWLAYTRLVGMSAPSSQDAVAELATRRTSVNDLVRAEMQEILARTDLTAADRQRLDRHFTAVRELETKMVAALSPADQMRLRAVDGKHRTQAVRLEVERMQMELIVLALASGATRVAFLQIGDGTDAMRYTVDGVTLPSFHLVSHRASSDGAVSDGTMPMAADQHHKVDRIVLGQLGHFLDRLAAVDTPSGSLLDTGFAVWANQVATGSHNTHNVPFFVAGKAGGFWKTGQYFSATGTLGASPTGTVPHNKLLNVFVKAMGIRTATGGVVDDFGDPSLPKGLLPGVEALV